MNAHPYGEKQQNDAAEGLMEGNHYIIAMLANTQPLF